MEDRWLSVDDIAAYLGIKRDTVQDFEGGQNRERPEMIRRQNQRN